MIYFMYEIARINRRANARAQKSDQRATEAHAERTVADKRSKALEQRLKVAVERAAKAEREAERTAAAAGGGSEPPGGGGARARGGGGAARRTSGYAKKEAAGAGAGAGAGGATMTLESLVAFVSRKHDVTYGVVKDAANDYLGFLDDDVPEVFGACVYKARPPSHWSPYDPVRVVNADP